MNERDTIWLEATPEALAFLSQLEEAEAVLAAQEQEAQAA